MPLEFCVKAIESCVGEVQMPSEILGLEVGHQSALRNALPHQLAGACHERVDAPLERLEIGASGRSTGARDHDVEIELENVIQDACPVYKASSRRIIRIWRANAEQ